MLIHMHEPHSSGVHIITHFDRVEVVMQDEYSKLAFPTDIRPSRNSISNFTIKKISILQTRNQTRFEHPKVYKVLFLSLLG